MIRRFRIQIAIPIIFFILFCSYLSLAACPDGELVLVIEGNTKTRESVIRRIAGLEGRCAPGQGVDAGEIRRKLLNSHLFSKVDVAVDSEDTKTIVTITLKERWTIIPLPIYFSNEEETGGGMFLVEMNLLGRKKILALGATSSNIAQRFNGFYVDDAVWGSRWVIVSSALYSDEELTKYEDEDKVYVYRQIYNQYFLVAGKKITDHWLPGAGLMYRYQQTDGVDDYAAPPRGGSSHSAIVNLRYENIDFTDYYDRGITANFLAEQSFSALGTDKDVGHFISTVTVVEPVWRLLARGKFETGWSWGADTGILTEFLIGGFVGNRGLPSRGLWVPEYGLASGTVEEKVWNHKYGILTLSQFFDITVTDEDDPVRSYPAAGAGLRVYLKEIAIPAVGVDGAYSMRNDAWHVHAFLGGEF